MSLYSATSEETLRVSKLLKDWAGEGFLTKEQYEHLQKETVSDLRTTNIFLRIVLFLFTLIGVAAATGLVFKIFLDRPPDQTTGVFFIVFAVAWYLLAEFAASQAYLYRHGIEEALAVCSVAFLCAGIQIIFFNNYDPRSSHAAESLVPAVGAIFSLWIWRRFGLWYAFLAAMIFTAFLPGYWTHSSTAQHIFIALFYTAGLVGIIALRSRHRFDYLDETYSLAEAFLWLGIYVAINLRLSSPDLLAEWLAFGPRIGRAASEFPAWFYWTTFVLIWCLPVLIIARGIGVIHRKTDLVNQDDDAPDVEFHKGLESHKKDRFVLAIGALCALLTFISNKPYLGWPRHTWDPMILGILLTGIAIFLRRWLARGPGGIRHGFTAARLSGKDKHWMELGSTVLGMTAPQAVTPAPQPAKSDFHFGGGQTGGGGAFGDF